MISKLLLLMGPSGTGKTTLVEHLRVLDDRFMYISPYMTRPLRSGETDKVAVSEEELERMLDNHELVVVNELYGIKYGTPRRPIEAALDGNGLPVIDWPIAKLSIMEKSFPGRLFRAYVMPPDIATLERRLAGRLNSHQRFAEGRAEIEAVLRDEYEGSIDLMVTNANGQSEFAAQAIYEHYLISCAASM